MTKRIKQIGGIILMLAIFSSCVKTESISSSATTVGKSKIVFFPSIKVNGETLIILYVGDTYTDAGATAILDEKPYEYTTVGSVDLTTPGVYQLDYSAVNAEGFSVSDFRTVVVIDGNSVAANDFSGTYARYVAGVANGQTSTWTKTGVGVYTVDNPGGAAGLTVTAVNYNGKTVTVPKQHTAIGAFATTAVDYDDAASPKQYVWAVINGTYGPSNRTFKKQ